MDYRVSHLDKGADYDEGLSRGDFDTYMTEREKEILLSAVTKLFGGKIPRYLDFACGTGRITQIIETVAEKSYGVDVSEQMLKQARQKCIQTTFVLGDATQEKLSIEPVNMVTAFRFFGNAQDELRVSALRAIYYMLADNGYLILNNHRNPWCLWNMFHRFRGDKVSMDLHYCKLNHLLSKSGFRVVRIYGIGFWVFRDRLNRPDIWWSRTARILEPISKVHFWGHFCPDMVIITQKITGKF